ncbi:hypothetical protein IFM61606_09217 [Aspergillus udagawae]|uniref:Uncharacterized protein n=1 Tax=Aspergillus udagawae TaxID=91492 RepID=A0A8E0UZ32_9EURO|nr:uncharacterized protein Aud_005515 [Aspergillus udagawae]GFF24679.1 hypothetical protein IFM61606_09217 [Aspergillus udagawae]GIC89113.1 hypothetical protein Aud_005515 [Aspergillus udagawae]
MHLSPWAFATFITAATAATLQVNYYSDGGCSNYMTELKPSPSPTTCVDYVWGGSNSMNIAACTFPNGKCICTVYTQPHCKGAQQTVVYGGDNCASNWGRGFYSFKCSVEHGL